METKRLSAKGVFNAKKNITRTSFFAQCAKQLYCGDSTIKRFWEAKEKISADIYQNCCNIAKINPEQSEDRTPLECIISQAALQAKLNSEKEQIIKSTLYNQITIFKLQLSLEPNVIVVSGKWRAELRDDYHETPKEIEVFLSMFMVVGGIKVVTIEDKKLFQVSSGGDFCLKYLVTWQDFKINVNPIDVTINVNNQLHKVVFQNLTKYENRVTEPIKECGIFSDKILQEVFEQAVTHKYFKITEFSSDNNSINLTIDESYPENKSLLEADLSGNK